MGGGSHLEREKLICCVCHELPKVVMECGCCFSIFCKQCVCKLKDTLNGCPNCGKTTNNFTLNVPLQRIVDQQESTCKFTALGCETVIGFSEKEKHEENCHFSLVECPFECGISLISGKLEEHKDSKCSMRQVECPNTGCDESLPLALLDLHQNECRYVKIRCNQCFKELVKKGLKEHKENTCPETIVSCPFTECGCCEQIPRRLLMSHLDKNTKLHLQLVLKVVGKQQQEISSLKNELNDVKNERFSLNHSLHAFADCTIDSMTQWLSSPKNPSWFTLPQFNLMFIWLFELMFLLFLVSHQVIPQSHLVITSFCIFMGYFHICNQMDISWFVKCTACFYFNLAYTALLYICL